MALGTPQSHLVARAGGPRIRDAATHPRFDLRA